MASNAAGKQTPALATTDTGAGSSHANWGLYVLVFATAAFISGKIYGVPIKYILFLYIFAAILPRIRAALVFLRNHRPLVFLYLASSASLVIWVFVGMIRGNPLSYVLTESMLFLVTPALILVFYALSMNPDFSHARVLRVALYGIIVYTVFKLGLNLFAVSGLVGFEQVGEFLAKAFGTTQFVSVPIWPSGFFRLHFTNDLLLVTLLGLALLLDRENPHLLGPVKTFIFYVLGAISIYLSYSRVIWVLGGGFLAGKALLLRRRRLNLTRVAVLGVLVVIIAILFAWVLADREDLYYTIAERFSSSAVDWSDEIRTQQIERFPEQFEQYWVVGLGWGGYIEDYVRSQTYPWAYEMQIPSFAFKLGFIGFSIYCLSVISLFMHIASSPVEPRYKGYLCLLYCGLLLAGFTNPSVVTSTYGLALILILSVTEELAHPLALKVNSPPGKPISS